MKGRLFYLLLTLGIGFGGITGPGICAVVNPPLTLVPDPQQGQASPVTFHDIRGPVELPDSSTMLFWLVIGLAVVALIGLFLYFWKRRKKGGKQPFPHEIALAELSRLRSMMNPGQALIYAEQLSELLRRYIEARFLLPSTRQTTREFFAGLNKNPQTIGSMAAHHDRLQGCLEQCDMAKFAHCFPGQLEMETMEQAVRGFIEATGQPVDEKGKG